MIHIEEVNDIYELSGYRLLWNALLPQTRNATFFQSFDWLKVYWEHFGQGQRLRTLVVSRDGKPLGILPLVVRSESSHVGRIRVLTYPLHDWGTFYGPIGPNPTATLTAALRYIRQTARDYDVFELRWIDRQGCDLGRTEAAMRQLGFSPQGQAWNRAAYVDLNGNWEQYWQGRPKKWRQNVCRLERRLAERGKITHIRYRPEGSAYGDDDPRWDLYDACVALAKCSWQGSSRTGTTLCHPRVCRYLRDTHAAAARNGSLDLNLLLLNDRPVAFNYNYCYQGRVYGLRKGFDPEFAALRPGLALQHRMIKDSFQRGDSYHDMGVGYLDMKRHWLTSIVTSFRYTHFPIAVPRVQLLRLKRWLQQRVLGQQRVACL